MKQDSINQNPCNQPPGRSYTIGGTVYNAQWCDGKEQCSPYVCALVPEGPEKCDVSAGRCSFITLFSAEGWQKYSLEIARKGQQWDLTCAIIFGVFVGVIILIWPKKV